MIGYQALHYSHATRFRNAGSRTTQAHRYSTVYGDLSIYGCASFTSALQRASTSGPCLACSMYGSIDALIDGSIDALIDKESCDA